MQAARKHPKTTRWWDLPTALLLLAALLTAAIRLSATNWTEELPIVQILTVIGLAVGLALGQSAFSAHRSAFFAFVYGLFFVGWQLGRTMEDAILWPERMASLGGRLMVAIGQLATRKPVTDPLLFLTLMALLFWMLSVHAGYAATRHAHPWLATLPTGLALFIIHIHDPYWPYRTWFLATYIFFALLLLARATYLHHLAAWQRAHTRLPPYLGLDLIRITLMATMVIVVLSWTAPALASSVPLAERAWNRLSRPWIIARSRMSNAFASLQASVGLVYDYYGDALPLGRGNRLTNDRIISVKAPIRPETVVRYYWRAKVYDTYEDGLWTGNYDQTIALSPQNFDIPLPEEQGRLSTTFDITTWAPLSTLLVAPQPEWVSRPVRADLVYNGDGTADMAAVHAQTNVRPGETYQVHASLVAASESELRAAGTDYPDWVRQRYLQLPENITARTYALAQAIAEGYDNPYDKAVAVTTFLRQNIEYTDIVPVPPADQDPVDWVLFDLKQGFCNYYATAEIVLLRAMGIPARWAVGYAQGEYNPQTGTYEVRQRDAHSWPEVYFPGIGWVEFEPTLSQPAINRPLGTAGLEGEGEEGSAGTNLDPLRGLEEEMADIRALAEGNGAEAGIPTPSGFSPLTSILILVVAVALIGASAFAWRRRPERVKKPLPILLARGLVRVGLNPPPLLRRWASYARAAPMVRAYNEMNRALARLGSPPHSHDTPSERTAQLAAVLPTLGDPAYTLLREYQKTIYGHRPGDMFAARRAARLIRKTSWLAWLQRLLARWQEPTPRRTPSPDLPGW